MPSTERSGFFMDINPRSTRDIHLPTLSRGYLNIYHQNIRSLKRKTHELLSHLYPNLAHILCLTEHHLSSMELSHVNLENCTIGAQFCRSHYAKGGVVMYRHNNLNATNIDLSKYCKEKDIEICAVKLNLNASAVCIVTVYNNCI